jgi:hypothetical protein
MQFQISKQKIGTMCYNGKPKINKGIKEMISKLQLRLGVLLVATTAFFLTACGATATTTSTITLTEQQKSALRTIAQGMGGSSSSGTNSKIASTLFAQSYTETGPDANGWYTGQYTNNHYQKGLISGTLKYRYKNENQQWITWQQKVASINTTYYYEETTTENNELFQLEESGISFLMYDIGNDSGTFNYTATLNRTITFNNTVTNNISMTFEYKTFKQDATYKPDLVRSTTFEYDVPVTLNYGTAVYTGSFNGAETKSIYEPLPLLKDSLTAPIYDAGTQIGSIVWNIQSDVAEAYDINGTKLE